MQSCNPLLNDHITQGNMLLSPVVKISGVFQILHFLSPLGFMTLCNSGTGRFALETLGGDFKASRGQQQSSTSSTLQLCKGEPALLSLISGAEKLLFTARLFLPLYFCPSYCQQVLAGISIAVLNLCLTKAHAGWAWTSLMQLHWVFSIFLIHPGPQPELHLPMCKR